MHNLIVSPLHKGRIDRDKGLDALTRQPCAKGHGMLFRQPDIIGAGGKILREQVKACSRWHRGCNGNDFIIGLGFGDEGAGKNCLIERGGGL